MANLLEEASILLTPTAYNDGNMLSVKPTNGDGDFDFTRNSAATRVNSQGLVENVQILSSDLVSNGNFSQEGSEEVLNGSFSQEGADLVTNGGFATDSDWVLNDWNISGGLLNASASTGIVFQSNLGLTVGKTYKATLEVSNYVSGAIRFKLGGSSYQNIASTNGIQEFFFIASTTANNILFSVLSAYTGSIDNVSVKEVGQDWTLGSGWSVGDDKVNTIGENQYLIQTNVSGSGVSATLKVQWTQEITSGSRLRFFPRNFNDTGGVVVLYSSVEGTGSYTNGNAYGDGVFTVYVKTTDGYSFKMLSETGNDGSVTGVSVKEVGQDWTLDVGWGIGDNEAVVNNTANADLEQTCMVSGRKYKVSFEISDLLSGGISVGDIVNPGAYAATNNGLHSFIYTATHPTLRVRAWGNPCSITNISVVEITDDTNLPRIDYTDGCGSWLLEPQSTNTMTTSEPITNNSYKTGVVFQQTNIYSWNGIYYGDNSERRVAFFNTPTVVGIDITFSVFVKMTNGNVPEVGSSPTDDFKMYIGSGLDIGSIVDVGNGVYRCSVTRTSSTTNYLIGVEKTTSNSENTFEISGFQVEQGLFPTSYIPTNGAASTRLRDLAGNSGNASLINSTEGVLYAEISSLATNSIGFPAISIEDGTVSNQVCFFYSSVSNEFKALIRQSGNKFFVATTLADSTDFIKVALLYKSGGSKLYINGSLVSSNTVSFSFTNPLDVLKFSGSGGLNNFLGRAKAVAVYKTALTDEQLTALTTI